MELVSHFFGGCKNGIETEINSEVKRSYYMNEIIGKISPPPPPSNWPYIIFSFFFLFYSFK